MERSQSCSSFETSNIKTNNNSHFGGILNNNNSASLQLLKAIELRQTQLHHLQQQLQEQQQLTRSNESLHALAADAASFATPHNLPLLRALRKKPLQTRTKSSASSVSAADEEADYAADLEEDGDEEEQEHNLSIHHHTLPLSSIAMLPAYQKQLQFQKRKPHSAAALMINTTAASAAASNASNSSVSHSSTPSTASSTCCSSLSSSSSGAGRRRLLKHEESFDSAPADINPSPHPHMLGQLQRDNSVQSDSSRYSSVDSLLEARKPDPEAILINLGFGPEPGSEDILARIPKRFLGPSQVRGIDTDAFVRRLQMANLLADHSVLGYRGLTGNPDIPPSSIVAKIMRRFELNQRKKSMGSVELKNR